MLDEISFQAQDIVKSSRSEADATSSAPLPVIERSKENVAGGESEYEKVVVVGAEYVKQQVAGIVKSQDFSRYIL